MNDDEKQTLQNWTERLVEALRIGDLPVDVDAVLDLAGQSAHAVLRPAAPLTTFLVGYAAGRAAAAGHPPADAVHTATATALGLIGDE